MPECEPLSLPTWVLGVTLRKEAPKPFRISLALLFITDLLFVHFITELTDFRAAGL